jgi:fibronectin type III domain protein/beta-propeller repeat-containing protein
MTLRCALRIIFPAIFFALFPSLALAALSAPSSLSATAISGSQINLAWVDNSNNENGFEIERTTVLSGPWTKIATTGAGVKSYANTGLSGSITYYYRVRAYKTGGSSFSAYSNTANATTLASVPNAPNPLTATAVSASQINLSWADNSSNESGFKIERATSSGGPWSYIATTGTNTTSYWNTGLSASTRYYYRARAYNTAGDSAYSNTASATTTNGTALPTLPTAPSALNATAASSSQVNLTWSDNSSNESGFKIERAPASNGPWTQIATAGAGAVAYSNTGLSASTTYYYRVRAYNTAGDSAYSNTANVTTIASSSGGGALWWAEAYGGTGHDYGQAVAVDRNGNVVLTGNFVGRVDFGEGLLPCTGTSNVVLAKYSASGLPLWTQCFVGAGNGSGRAVAVDGNGDVVVTGYFGGTLDFGGGPLSSVGGYDIFVAKYSGADGRHLWSKRFGSAADAFGAESGYGVAVDGGGNVAVTGSFYGTVDFGGGALRSAGDPDIFLVKLSAAGTHLWSKRFGAVGNNEAGNAVAVDGGGNVVLTGRFNGAVDFGGGALAGSGVDIFVAKFSSAGTHLWSERFGGTGSTDSGNGVAVDGSGNVVLTGNFGGTTDFGSGALTSVGGDDIFVAKFSSAGTPVWSKRFGDPFSMAGFDVGRAVAVDGSGNVVVTGVFLGAVNFGGGALTGAGSTDVFVAKFSSAGTHLWSKRFGGTTIDEGLSVAVNGGSNVVVTGRFLSSINFGDGPLTAVGASDVFVTSFWP